MKNLFNSKKTVGLLFAAAATSALISTATGARAQDWDNREFLGADLVSFNQVPAVLANSKGRFAAEIKDDGRITFALIRRHE